MHHGVAWIVAEEERRHHAVAWVAAVEERRQQQRQRQSALWERREKRCLEPLDSLRAMVDQADVCVLHWSVSLCVQPHQVLSHLGVMALVCATLLVLSSLCALVLVLACLLQVATVCHALAPGNRRVLWLSSRSRFGLLGGLCVLATGLSQPDSPAMVECRRHSGHTPFCSNLCVDVGLGMNLLSPLCEIKAWMLQATKSSDQEGQGPMLSMAIHQSMHNNHDRIHPACYSIDSARFHISCP
jgi:endogenous inhibitor of DNA gyrase (YacG/DUF329 family)